MFKRLVKDKLCAGRWIAYLEDRIQVFYTHELQSLAGLFSGALDDVCTTIQYHCKPQPGLEQTDIRRLVLPPPLEIIEACLRRPYALPLASRVVLATVSLVALTSTAQALPTGYQSTSGNVQFSQSGDTLNVTTSAQKSIATYQSFNIAQHETVNFNLPSRSSAILNRVTGGTPSQIFGRMTSNGQVFITNSSGIVFGKTAQVNVGGLHASTLDIRDDDFLAGKNTLAAGPEQAAGVENQGEITAAPGGYVVLSGAHVNNSGNIYAPSGKVAFAVGDKVSMTVDDNLAVNVTVDETLKHKVEGAQAAIQNTGAVLAPDGQIELIADVNRSVYTQAINNQGVLEAKGLTADGGLVHLENGGDGLVTHQGRIDVTSSTGNGGLVEVLGQYVAATQGAVIDASGETGGGTILFGGDFQGNGSVQNAWRTFVDHDSLFKANAITTGHGGKVILWSDDTTWFYGNIEAKGGSQSGDGGFVEVSGHGFLTYDGFTDTTALHGQMGSLLLDPTNIIVVASGGETSSLTAVDAFADPDIGGDGNVTLNVSAINSSASNVTLRANNDITVNAAINMTSSGKSLTLFAGNNVNVNQSITTNNGTISLYANSDDNNSGTLNIDASVNAGTGFINLKGSQIKINNSVSGYSVDISNYDMKNFRIGNATDDADSATYVDISQAELSRITANSVTIFQNYGWTLSTAGNITIASSGAGSFNLSLGNPGYLSETVNISHTITTNNKNLWIISCYNNLTADINAGTGSVTINSVFDYDLYTSPVTTLGANITAGTITLSADDVYEGYGTIFMRTAGTLTATTLNLTDYGTLGTFGSSGSPIVTSVGTITLSGSSGDSTYISEADSVTLGASIFSNLDLKAGNSITTSGAVSANTAVALTTTANNGNITIGGNLTGNVSLTAHGSGSITQTSGTISGTTISLTSTSGNIGSSGTRLSTSTTTLTANTGGSGGVWITNPLGLTLGTSTAGSGGFDLRSNSNISTSGTLTTSAGAIVLQADYDGNNSGNLVINNAIASNNGSIRFYGAQLDINSTVNSGTSGIDLRPSYGKPFLFANSVDDQDNATNVEVSQAELNRLTAGSTSTFGAGASWTTTAGNFTQASTGLGTAVKLAGTGVTISHAYTGTMLEFSTSQAKVNASVNCSNSVTFFNSNPISLGGIVDDADTPTVMDVSQAELNRITASTLYIGNGNSQAVTTNGNLTIASSGAGSYNLSINSGTGTTTIGHTITTNNKNFTVTTTSASGIAINNTVNAGSGNITLSTTANNGVITLAGSLTGTTLTLTANGSGTISQSSGTLTGTTVNLTSSSGAIGTSGARIQTAANTLTANTTGNVYISEANSVTLGASTGSTFDLLTGSNGAITLGGNATATTLNLTANGSGNIVYSSGTLTGTTINMTSTSGAIGTSGARIQTSAGTLTANTTGNVYVTEADAVTLGASTGSTFDLLTGSNGTITLGGNTTATTLNLTANGSGTITYSSGILTGTTVNLTSTSGTIGTSGARVQTAANTLTANTTGNVYISEANAVTLGASTGSTFDLLTGSNGSITLNGNLTGSSTVVLTANGSGNITRSGGTVQAGTGGVGSGYLTLASTSGNIGTSGAPIYTEVTGSGVTYTHLYLTTSGSSYIQEISGVQLDTSTVGGTLSLNVSTSLATAGTIQAGTLTLNSTGSITSAGALTATNITVSSNSNITLSGNLTASNTLSLTAIGAGTITQSAGSLSGSTVNLTSTSGAIGTSGARIQTNAGTLTANTSGNVYVTEADAVTLGASTGSTFDLLTGSNGTITLGGNTTVTTLNLTANGSGDIARTSGTLTANTVNLTSTSGAIGTSGSRIQTAANYLTMNTTGNIYISESNGAYFAGSSGGVLDIISGGSLLQDANVVAGGNLVLTTTSGDLKFGYGDVTVGGTLTATSAGAIELDYGFDASFSITSTGHLSFTGTSILDQDWMPIATTVGNVTLTATAGDIRTFGLSSAGTLTETATGEIGNYAGMTSNGQVIITADSDADNSGEFRVTGGFVTNNHNITVQAATIALGGASNAGTGTITILPSTSKAIQVGGNASDSASLLSLTSTELNILSASNMVIGSTSLSGGLTIGANYDFSAKWNLTLNNGGAYTGTGYTLTNGAKSLTVNALGTLASGSVTGTSGTINLTSGGTITVDGTVSQSGTGSMTLATSSNDNIVIAGNMGGSNSTVSLNANGSGTITRSGNYTVTGASVSLASGSGSIGTSGSRIQTAAGTLTANTTGNVYVTEADAVTLGASTASTFDLLTGSNGSITLGGNTTATTLNLTVNGSGNIVYSSGTLMATTVNLTSTSGAIGTSGARIQTSAGILTANTVGNVYISEANSVTLGASTGSTFDLLTGSNGAITLGGNTTATTLNLTANGSGNIVYSSGTLMATTVNLTSTSGAIGTSGARIQTSAGTLTANTTGNVYVTEADAVTLGASTGSMFDLLNNTGNLTLSGLVSANQISLQSSGSILDGNGVSNNLLASGNSLLVAQGYIGTLANPLDVVVTGGTLSVQAAGQLAGVSVDIAGTVSPSNALTVVSAPGQVIFNGQMDVDLSQPYQALTFLLQNPNLQTPSTMNELLTSLKYQEKGLMYQMVEPRNQNQREFHLNRQVVQQLLSKDTLLLSKPQIQFANLQEDSRQFTLTMEEMLEALKNHTPIMVSLELVH